MSSKRKSKTPSERENPFETPMEISIGIPPPGTDDPTPDQKPEQYDVQANHMDANHHLLELQMQLKDLAEQLGEKLDRVGRSGVGGKDQKLQAARRIAGVTLPPIERKTEMMSGIMSGTGQSGGWNNNTANTTASTPAFRETQRRERLIKKGIFEAQDIMSQAERVRITTSSPTKLDLHEKQYGDALAALQYSNTNGELNNVVRAKEIELAKYEQERDAIQRGYMIARRKFEAMKQRQEEISNLTDGHAEVMAELRHREKEVDKLFRAKEQESALNHRQIEDLSVQLQKVNHKLPKAEVEVLTRLWELKEGMRVAEREEAENIEENEKTLVGRKKLVEGVTQEIAIFDADTWVQQYWNDLESRSSGASPMLQAESHVQSVIQSVLVPDSEAPENIDVSSSVASPTAKQPGNGVENLAKPVAQLKHSNASTAVGAPAEAGDSKKPAVEKEKNLSASGTSPSK